MAPSTTTRRGNRKAPTSLIRKKLSDAFPDIAAQWHPEKNEGKSPKDFTYGSTFEAWWVCKKGGLDHDWQMSINRRTSQGQGCPYCAGKRVSPADSLAACFPEIANQWHKQKNAPLKPSDILPGSGMIVWWHCKRNRQHEWEAAVYARTSKNGEGTGCPFCGHKRPHRKNNLAALFPQIADEWHPRKNGRVAPSDVLPSSHTIYWWQCLEVADHVWRMSCNRRTSRASGCPYCSGHKLHRTNSLATRFPRIAKEWHPTKNGRLTPDKVTAGTNKVVWWQCPKVRDHEYSVPVKQRTGMGSGCPYCANKKVDARNSLAATDPAIAAEWHPKLNGPLTPHMVTRGSSKVAYWQCPRNAKHVWSCQIQLRTLRWKDCELCASLQARFPNIAKEFDLDANYPLTPETVRAGSSKKVAWICSVNARHRWFATVTNRTGRNSNCPYCWKERQQRGRK